MIEETYAANTDTHHFNPVSNSPLSTRNRKGPLEKGTKSFIEHSEEFQAALGADLSPPGSASPDAPFS